MASVTHPTDEEKAKFVQSALNELDDPAKRQEFEDNVKQVAVWAIQVDEAFDKVTRDFKGVIDKRGTDFPGLATYLREWEGFKGRWAEYLWGSRDVASQHIATLKQFDQVYLEIVETIENNEEREEAIATLKQFASENHEDTVKLSQNILAFKRDIQDFFTRFDKWFVNAGLKLDKETTNLKNEIDELSAEIVALGQKIKDGTTALAICGGLLTVGGVVVPGTVLAALQTEIKGEAIDLQMKIKALQGINEKQPDPAHLKTEFDILEPGINLTSDKLIILAGIWPTVSTIAIHIQERLQGGMEVVGDSRFKNEIRLTRKVCTVLGGGLEKYAVTIVN